MLNVNQDYYRLFYYVCRYRSLTKAANILQMSQPNMTRGLNRLEAQLGCKLLVRNTRGVTGFVGPGSKPVPLTDEEVTKLGVEYIPIELDLSVGESVRVVSGPLENFIGTVEALDPERQKVKLTVSIFNRDTPVELDYIQVQKL